MRFGWSNIQSKIGTGGSGGPGVDENAVNYLIDKKLKERLGKLERTTDNTVITVYDKLGPAVLSVDGKPVPITESLSQVEDAFKIASAEIDEKADRAITATQKVADDLALQYTNEQIEEKIAAKSTADKAYVDGIKEALNQRIDIVDAKAVDANDVIVVKSLSEITDPRPGVMYIEDTAGEQGTVDTGYHWNEELGKFEALAGTMRAVNDQGAEIVATPATEEDIRNVVDIVK